MNSVSVKTPATTANLGPGFDTLGLALKLYNTLELTEMESGLVIENSGEGATDIPTDESNVVYQTAQLVFRQVGYVPSAV